MSGEFPISPRKQILSTRITEVLARRVIEADRRGEPESFPKESELCEQLGVSRSVLRESMKVLVDKGMIEMKPRAGTRARPRTEWRLLDPDILAWQADSAPDARFLRDLCEVRLAIEPTAAGFAAVRATRADMQSIENCLRMRGDCTPATRPERIIDLDLGFHTAVVAASHNPLLEQLSATIRHPFRVALACTASFPSTIKLGLEAHRALVEALHRRDPIDARKAAEEIVGLAMLAVEKVVRSKRR